MKKQTLSRSFSRVSLALGVTLLGIFSSVGQAALGEENNNLNFRRSTDQGTGDFQRNQVDSQGDGLFGGSLNPFDLIHRSRLNPSRSADVFNEDTDEGLGKAAEEFKRQQRLRLQQLEQQQQQGNSPTSKPQE